MAVSELSCTKCQSIWTLQRPDGCLQADSAHLYGISILIFLKACTSSPSFAPAAVTNLASWKLPYICFFIANDYEMAAFACDIWRTVFVCVTTTHSLYYITYWKMQTVISTTACCHFKYWFESDVSFFSTWWCAQYSHLECLVCFKRYVYLV